MSKKYPKPALWFRLLLALICWGVVWLMVYFRLVRDIPERQMPDEHFAVCVMDGSYPRFDRLSGKNWGKYPLCREALQYQDGSYRVDIVRDGDTVYGKVYEDIPGDPREFVYRLDERATPPTVIPLWWRHATTVEKIAAAFYAIPLAWLLYSVISFYVIRYRGKYGKENPR